MKTPPDPKALRVTLDRLYARYNHRRYVQPDPLQMIYADPDIRDREIAGMIAATLAFGNVKGILRSVHAVLETIGSPRHFLLESPTGLFHKTFDGFVYRFVRGPHLADLFEGMRQAVTRHGSLEACFLAQGDSALERLACFADTLRGDGGSNYLLPDPRRGSACKRFCLYLRWMVRRDAVDPGGWDGVNPADLTVPLDTHMHRIGRDLGLTKRAQADGCTARELTEAYRGICPEDPLRYDFALTRLGIMPERGIENEAARRDTWRWLEAL
jgi:uncharacterized protein (TIGR02757 family)